MPGGERTKLQVAHIKLSHSRAFLARAYLLQTHDLSHRAWTDDATMASMFDAHWHGFRVFGGVLDCGIYDNIKTAVGPVAYLCRPKCSFRPPSVRRPRGFSLQWLSGGGVDYRSR